MLCPCQSGEPYVACCQAYHQGAPAPSAVALMRARFSAYALNDAAFVQASWHSQTRPAVLDMADGERWLGLDVIHSEEDNKRGWVHFRATCRDASGFLVLEEHSRFVHETGRWFYVDGEAEIIPLNPGRNDRCPCNSGRKFKKCCATR